MAASGVFSTDVTRKFLASTAESVNITTLVFNSKNPSVIRKENEKKFWDLFYQLKSRPVFSFLEE